MSKRSASRKSRNGAVVLPKELPFDAFNLAPETKNILAQHYNLREFSRWTDILLRYEIFDLPKGANWQWELICRLAMDYAPEFRDYRRKEKWSSKMNAALINEVNRLAAEGSSKKKIFELLFDIRDEIDFIPDDVASADAIRKHYVKISKLKQDAESNPPELTDVQVAAIKKIHKLIEA